MAVDGTIAFLIHLHQLVSMFCSVFFFIQRHCFIVFSFSRQLHNEVAQNGPPAPGDPLHRTFDSFSAQGRKDADSSVRLVFGKQLRMIRGVSAEKALAVTREYPTPAALMRAYALSPSVYVNHVHY